MTTQLINFTIPKKLLKDVDTLAKKELKSRSAVLREAASLLTKKVKEKELNFKAIRASAKRVNMKELEAIKLVDNIRSELPINK